MDNQPFFFAPARSSLLGVKRKYGSNYNNTLVTQENRQFSQKDITMAGTNLKKQKSKKKFYKKKSGIGKQLTNYAVKKLMKPEKKWVEGSVSWYPNTASTASSLTLINDIGGGSSNNQRVGNRFQMISLDLKVSAIGTIYKGTGTNPTWMPMTVEYLVIQQKAAHRTALNIGSVKDVGTITDYPYSYHALLGDGKCKVLHRGVIDCDGTQGENNYREMHIPLGIETTYGSSSSGIANLIENSLYLVLLSSADVTTGTGGATQTPIYPTVQGFWRLKFIDV